MLKSTSLNKLSIFFSCLMILSSIAAVITAVFVLRIDHDEFEHMYCAWRISKGDIPYLDFFQHHNFLLWYLLAPFESIFEDSPNLVFIVRFVASIFLFLTTFFLYKILVLLNVSKSYAVSAACFFISLNHYVLKSSVELRIDIFMWASIAVASYFYILSLKKKNCQDKENSLKADNTFYTQTVLDKWINIELLLSVCFYSIAVVFLQKAGIVVIPVAVSMIAFMLIGRLTFRHLLTATTIPLLLLALFALYNHSHLLTYYISNFEFNMYYFKEASFSGKSKEQLYFLAMFIILSFLLRKIFYKNKIIFISLSIYMLLFMKMGAPYKEYYIGACFLIISMIFYTLYYYFKDKSPLFSVSVVGIITIFCISNYLSISHYSHYNETKRQLNTYSYILNHSNNNDEILGSQEICPVRKDACGYHYHNIFMYDHKALQKIKDKVRLDLDRCNINEIIVNEKPKFIWNEYINHYLIDNVEIQKIISEEYVKFGNTYVKKDK